MSEVRLIDANALKEEFKKIYRCAETAEQLANNMEDAIDNAPTVDTTFREVVAYECGQKSVEERPKGEWIPITMRPIEEEEKIYFPDATFMFDCCMPEDGQEILISTKYGVEFDTCFADDGYYLDSDRDWEDVYAWQPLPEPYKKGGDV